MGGCFTRCCLDGGSHHERDSDEENDVVLMAPVTPAQSYDTADAFHTPQSTPLNSPTRKALTSTVPPIPISKEMSSPTIRIESMQEGVLGGRVVTGHGLALVSSTINSDGAAYWEWHMQRSNPSLKEACLFGVSTKRTPKFYELLAGGNGSASSLKIAMKMMRPISTSTGDVIGIAIDLLSEDDKYIKLYLNGNLQEQFDLKSFRGSLFPSIWLPAASNEDDDASPIEAYFAHDEAHFQQRSPHAKFVPLPSILPAGATIV